MLELENITIKDAHEAMKRGDFSAVEFAEAYLKNIEEENEDLNAYLEVFGDVREQAQAADKKFADGSATLLTGIPIAVKDNILIKNRKVSAGSKILEGYTATYDAFVISKLKEAGAVFLGRTNMDEFAMGSSTENSAFGVTKNPHDTSRVPGGSSGGSAAAVAANMALAALGSDTGGSIRQPAALCGISGFKPSYGAVSRSGLIAMGSSLDQIGTLTKTAEDGEIMFNAIAGKDPKDSTSISEEAFAEAEKNGTETANKTITIGVPEDLLSAEGLDEDMLSNFKESIGKLEQAGHKVRYLSLPLLPFALAAYYIIMPAESSTNLARFDGVRYGLHKEGESGIDDYLKTRGAGFGKEVRRRIMLGTYVLSAGYKDAYYNKATHVRELIGQELAKAFTNVDVIAAPTAPAPAFALGEKTADPLQMYLEDFFTVPANIAGTPAASLPSGFAERGGKKLPLGFHLMAPHLADRKLFEISKKIEGIIKP